VFDIIETVVLKNKHSQINTWNHEKEEEIATKTVGTNVSKINLKGSVIKPSFIVNVTNACKLIQISLVQLIRPTHALGSVLLPRSVAAILRIR